MRNSILKPIGVKPRCRALRLLIAAFLAMVTTVQSDLKEEKITMEVVWTVPDSVGSSNFNYNRDFTNITSYNGHTYVVFTDKNLQPHIGRLGEDGFELSLLDPGYQAYGNINHGFSIGIDQDGFLHVAGDMRFHPDTSETGQLSEPYLTSSCLYWKSQLPQDIHSFTFLGSDTLRVIPGSKFSQLKFLNDREGVLYTASTQGVRADGAWTDNPGKIALALARYNVNSQTWTALGDTAPVFSEIHPLATPENWLPNHNKVLFWDPTGGVANTAWNQWGNDFYFDKHNRLHVSVGYTDDNSGFTQKPSSNWGTVIAYASSDDGGISWNRVDGSTIDSLPILTETSSIVASGHWYKMESGVVLSPGGKPLISYRYSPDGENSVLKWREFGNSYWQKEVQLPVFYRKTNPRVDHAGVITLHEYNDLYRTTGYDTPGVEHEMPYDMFSLNERKLQNEGVFQFAAKVNGKFGVVELVIIASSSTQGIENKIQPSQIPIPKFRVNGKLFPRVKSHSQLPLLFPSSGKSGN